MLTPRPSLLLLKAVRGPRTSTASRPTPKPNEGLERARTGRRDDRCPTPRTPKAPAKPQPKAEGTITVSQFEAIMTAMSNAAVAELRKQLG